METHPQTLPLAASLIEGFEGVLLRAYLDPVGVPTICAGVTVYPSGTPVRMGDACTEEVCRGHLMTLLRNTYIPSLECIPGWSRLGCNQQAALVSFAWNLGAKFYGAPGFETISRVLRDGATQPAAYREMRAALMLYVKAGGGTLPGLVTRRSKEADYWEKDANPMTTFTAQRDTYLKKAPIDSGYLSDTGKKLCPKGEQIDVSQQQEIAGDSHAWVTLENGEHWAIFLPHWQTKTAQPAPAAPTSVNWDDFSAPVGKYITVGEVLQNDARRKPRRGSPEEKNILAICAEFDKIREAWNGPIGVTSGYRPEPINSQVGGVPGSYHVNGMALDVYPIDASLDKFYKWIIKRWSGGCGDGRPKGFVHLDIRNGGHFSDKADLSPCATWLY